MPKFRYVVQKGGETERGTVTAESKADLVKRLKAQGYEGIRVKRAPGDTDGLFQRFFSR